VNEIVVKCNINMMYSLCRKPQDDPNKEQNGMLPS